MIIDITGFSGFIGKNILESKFSKEFNFNKIDLRSKNQIKIKGLCLIHLAGIAHDTSNKYSHEDYLKINYRLTKIVFDKFLKSKSKIFIFFSSSKAVRDSYNGIIYENTKKKPTTSYGISKLKAEKYIIKKIKNINSKKVYILRPAMIHGKHNKGNLNLLLEYIKKGYPWLFGSYINKRSYLSIDNLLFIINELISKKIPSGVYNVSDNDTISTNEIIELIKLETKSNNLVIKIPKVLINFIFKIFTILNFRFNNNMLNKITGNFVVSNSKIMKNINKKLPLDVKSGIKKTIKILNKV